MASRIDSQNPQQGRINAALDRLAELIDEDATIALKIELDAQDEAEREAQALRQQLAADGVDVIAISKALKVSSSLRKDKPR
jgi:hypothetical protein